MTGKLRHVQRGDPFPTDAGTLNAWNAAAMAHAIGQGGTGEGNFTPASDSGVVLVKNTSGVGRERFDVLGLDAPIITPTANLAEFKNGPAFKGVTPTADHRGRFVVLPEPVGVDGVIPARVAGLTVAKVDFTAGVFRYAETVPGNAGSLRASPIGSARILWPTTGTSVEWSAVLLGVGNSHELVGVELAEDHSAIVGTPFDVHVGTRDGTGWNYDRAKTYRAVDWRVGVPYPDKCATGQAEWFWNGSELMVEIVSLDCESPGCGYT